MYPSKVKRLTFNFRHLTFITATCSSRRPWRRGSFVDSFSTNKLYHGRLTLPYSNAESGESIFYIPSQPHFMNKCRYKSCTGTPQWMSDGNSASIDINDLRINIQIFDDCQGLDGKGLIQLNQTDIFHLQACALYRLLRCRDGAISHHARWHASRCRSYDPRQRFEIQCFGFFCAHDQ